MQTVTPNVLVPRATARLGASDAGRRSPPAHRIRWRGVDDDQRVVLLRHSNWKCAAVALVGTIVMCIRDHTLFTVPIHENTDYAANSILVNQAVHFSLLVGNYSREGFHHPGPAFLYIQSFGQQLFYSALHLVPSQYNGQLLAVFILGSSMLALTARTFARHVGSWTIAVAGLACVILLTGGTLSWASAWMPFLYAAPFLLAIVAGCSVAVGALGDLPVFTFATALLIHGHIAFVGIMGVFVVMVAVTWLLVNRRRGTYRRQLARARRALLASTAIVCLFALPILTNLVLHWPGQLKLYWHYVTRNPQAHSHTLHQAVTYAWRYWPGQTLERLLVLAAGVLAALSVVRERNSSRRRFLLGLLVVVVVVSIEVVVYALRGVDDLSFLYTGYFYFTVPPLFVAVLVLELGCRIRGWHSASVRSWRRHRLRRMAGVLVGCGAVGLLLLVPSFENSYRGDQNLPLMASAVASNPAREGRGIAIDLSDPGSPTADWSDVVGLLVAASRRGFQPCVANARWTFMMTNDYICSPPAARARWRIDVEEAGVKLGLPVVFHDETTTIYEAGQNTGKTESANPVLRSSA